MTTFCVDCRHVHEDSRKRSPTQWLCSRHKRLEGMGFVHPQYWTNEEPFLKCNAVNAGACPLFEPKEDRSDREA